MPTLSRDVRSACRYFGYFLGNGTLAPAILNRVDCLSLLAEGYGSTLEKAFAVFINVLDVTTDGKVTNEAAAMERAAQYLRSYLDSSYVISPPFEDWETELA